MIRYDSKIFDSDTIKNTSSTGLFRIHAALDKYCSNCDKVSILYIAKINTFNSYYFPMQKFPLIDCQIVRIYVNK